MTAVRHTGNSRSQEILKHLDTKDFRIPESVEWEGCGCGGGVFWCSALWLNRQPLSHIFYVVSTCLYSSLILKQTAWEFGSSRKSSGWAMKPLGFPCWTLFSSSRSQFLLFVFFQGLHYIFPPPPHSTPPPTPRISCISATRHHPCAAGYFSPRREACSGSLYAWNNFLPLTYVLDFRLIRIVYTRSTSLCSLYCSTCCTLVFTLQKL